MRDALDLHAHVRAIDRSHLRHEEPVHELPGLGIVVVTRHADDDGTASQPFPTLPDAVTARGRRGARAGNGRVRLIEKGRVVSWAWQRGQATDLADFGDPRNTRTHYAFCLYDESAPLPALVFRALAPAGGTCRFDASEQDLSCWREVRGGYRYRDDFRTPEGLSSMRLKEGSDGKARITLRPAESSSGFPPSRSACRCARSSRRERRMLGDDAPVRHGERFRTVHRAGAVASRRVVDIQVIRRDRWLPANRALLQHQCRS